MNSIILWATVPVISGNNISNSYSQTGLKGQSKKTDCSSPENSPSHITETLPNIWNLKDPELCFFPCHFMSYSMPPIFYLELQNLPPDKLGFAQYSTCSESWFKQPMAGQDGPETWWPLGTNLSSLLYKCLKTTCFRIFFNQWTKKTWRRQTDLQWNIIQPQKGTKLCHLQRSGWTQNLSYRMKQVRKRKTNINTYMWILEKWQMNLFAGQE